MVQARKNLFVWNVFILSPGALLAFWPWGQRPAFLEAFVEWRRLAAALPEASRAHAAAGWGLGLFLGCVFILALKLWLGPWLYWPLVLGELSRLRDEKDRARVLGKAARVGVVIAAKDEAKTTYRNKIQAANFKGFSASLISAR